MPLKLSNEMHMGNRISAIRKNLRLTQTELGNAIGVTQVSITHYESGSRYPDLDKAKAIVDFFNNSGYRCSFENVFFPAESCLLVAESEFQKASLLFQYWNTIGTSYGS